MLVLPPHTPAQQMQAAFRVEALLRRAEMACRRSWTCCSHSWLRCRGSSAPAARSV